MCIRDRNIGRAVRRGGAGIDDDINMVLVARSFGVLCEKLIKIYAGHGAKPAQNAQHTRCFIQWARASFPLAGRRGLTGSMF